MKYEITKEQLQELAKGNAKVERWFPEAFESEFINKWITLKINAESILIFHKSDSPLENYGFLRNGNWFTNENKGWSYLSYGKGDWRPATESEVFEALKKEAVKRGYIMTNFKCINSFYTTGLTSDNLFLDNEFRLWMGEKDNANCLFKDGEWAEIIKEKTLSKSEAEAMINEFKKDGYEYKIRCN